VRALAISLIDSSKAGQNRNIKELLFYAILLLEWLFHVKPGATNMHRANIRTDEALILARLHYDLWSRDGVAAHPMHLRRASQLFQLFFHDQHTYDNLDDCIIYFKVLQHLGENDKAASFITSVLPSFDTHPSYPNLLFYAGVAYKALNRYEKANNYFFEASQLGPPRFFTKLEMMVIISRVIEENGGEEDGNDEAYKMVSLIYLLHECNYRLL
jgi:tetratricopeptide (TPR) repeat protein